MNNAHKISTIIERITPHTHFLASYTAANSAYGYKDNTL